MKTNTCYRLGILAMCIMQILAIVVLFFGISMLNSDPEISGNGYGWSQLLFPVLGLVGVPIAGLVLYVQKKTLGWILCGGYSVFMVAFAFLVSYVFFGALEEISLLEDGVIISWVDILTVILILGVLCAIVWLFLSRQVRSVFPGTGQAGLSDVIPAVIVTAILIGIIIFLPRLLNFLKDYHLVIIIFTILLALRWLINQSGKSNQ